MQLARVIGDVVVNRKDEHLTGVPVLVLSGALAFWLQGGRHISTENAFVKFAEILSKNAVVESHF